MPIWDFNESFRGVEGIVIDAADPRSPEPPRPVVLWTVGRSLIEGAPPSEQPGIIEKFSIGAPREIPQISELILGDSEGNFGMFRRSENGGSETKLSTNTAGEKKWCGSDATPQARRSLAARVQVVPTIRAPGLGMPRH